MKCEICGKEVSAIKSHIKHCHPEVDTTTYITCKICNKQITPKGLSYHITHAHNITNKEYYDLYIKKDGEGICCKCGTEAEFINISVGYRKTCAEHTIRPKLFECKICGQTMKNPGPHLQKHNISQKDYYDLYCKKAGDGICKICGKETAFIRVTVGYAKHCSDSCAIKDPEIQDKIKQTNVERYGVAFPIKLTHIQEKVKQTKRKKYGDENFVNSKQAKQTKQERYGDENYNNREKHKQTCLEKWGVEHHWLSEEVQEKRRQTFIEKYGAENPWKNQEVQDKCKNTIIDKHGGLGYASEEIANKVNKTNIERFGTKNAQSNTDIHTRTVKSRKANQKKKKALEERLNQDNM